VSAAPSYRKGLSFSALSFGVLAVLGLITSVAIARIYGVSLLGEFALATAPVNILFALSSAREQVALIRELTALSPRAPRVTGLFYAVLIFSFGLTAALALLTVAVVYLLFHGPVNQPALFVPTVAYIAGYTLIQNTCWNVDMVFSAFGAGKELFWTRLNQALVFIALAVAVGYVWKSIWGLVAATVLSYLTSLVHKAVLLRRYMRASASASELRAGLRTLPELIRFGLKLAPGQIADGISNEAATLTLGVFSPVATVGAYSRAWQLGRRFLDLQWRVTEMLFPTLVRRHTEGDRGGFDRVLIDSIRYSMVGMLLPAAAMGGAAAGIMRIFGNGFSSGSNALAVIMLMPALTSMSAFQRGSLVAVNRPWTTTVSGAIRMTATVAATIVLTIYLDATGAAIGLIVGVLCDLLYTSHVTRKHLLHSVLELWRPSEMIALALAYGTAFAAARVVYSTWTTWPGLLAALIASCVVYVLVFVSCGGVVARDRTRIASVRESWRQRRGAVGEPTSA
jgi:O-antigen/teichoic acid export membrane protein